MNRTILLIVFINCNLIAFSQSIQKSNPSKNILKVSPAVNFGWSSSLMSKESNYKSFNLMTGLNFNYQRQDKLNNYHDVGFIIGIIPMSSKTTSTFKKSYNAKQVGVEYNYKIVFAKYKNNNLQIFTAIGTQLIYTKTQKSSSENYQTKYKSKSIEQNLVVTPGIQYSKNHFYIDFSLPASIGYKHLTNSINDDTSTSQPDSEQNNLLDWNIGIKAGVGAKF